MILLKDNAQFRERMIDRSSSLILTRSRPSISTIHGRVCPVRRAGTAGWIFRIRWDRDSHLFTPVCLDAEVLKHFDLVIALLVGFVDLVDF